MNILQILEELASTSSTVEKQYILQKYKSNIVLQRFFSLTLHPSVNFFIRKIPEFRHTRTNLSLTEAMDRLSKLSSRRLTGNSAKAFLADTLGLLSPDDAEVITRIIKKDPECGVSHKTVNKIWKNLIPEFPCMLASKHDEKLTSKLNWKEGVYVQLKSDGMRAAVICHEDGRVEVLSRNGKTLTVNGHFDRLASQFSGHVIDGELLVLGDDGKPLDRKTGNGICNKAVHGTISDEECSKLYLMAWDIIPVHDFYLGKYEKEYRYRFAELVSCITGSNKSLIKRIPTNVCYSMEDAVEAYRSYVANGEEGAILKDAKMIWENKRSKGQIKMKEELDADLKIVGVKEHSKRAGQIGSLILESKCGKLKVDCGSGLTDELRLKDASEFIGKIAAIKYNAVIQEKTQGHFSLFLPILVEIREDKDTANTLSELQ